MLEERGRQRPERSLRQAFDHMALTWATINRFEILILPTNKKTK